MQKKNSLYWTWITSEWWFFFLFTCLLLYFLSAQSTNCTRDEGLGCLPRSAAQNRERFDGKSGVSWFIGENSKSICIFVHICHRAWRWRYLKRLCIVYDGAIASKSKITVLQQRLGKLENYPKKSSYWYNTYSVLKKIIQLNNLPYFFFPSFYSFCRNRDEISHSFQSYQRRSVLRGCGHCSLHFQFLRLVHSFELFVFASLNHGNGPKDHIFSSYF